MKDYKTKSNESPVVKHLLSIHKFDISMNIFFSIYLFYMAYLFNLQKNWRSVNSTSENNLYFLPINILNIKKILNKTQLRKI